MTIPVYDLSGKKMGRVAMPKEIAAASVNDGLMAQAVYVYETNQHQGTRHTKTRAEVEASKRKLYRQKGTGRARAGSASAPHRVGGGVAHGPVGHKIHLNFPRKMRQRALWSALKSRVETKNLLSIAGFAKMPPKTKAVLKLLAALRTAGIADGRTLVVTGKSMEGIVRACRNIHQVDLLSVDQLSTYHVLRAKHILVAREIVSELAHA